MHRFARAKEALTTSLWFVPSLCVLAAIVVSTAVLAAEPVAEEGQGGTWLYGGGAESARTLLSTLAASMITFLGLTFSITMVVLQLTSAQYSPRALGTFLRDRQSQWTLGTFVATFVFVVLVLRSVRGPQHEDGQLVPGLAITIALLLLLASIGAFVGYINHIAQAIRPETIIQNIADETRRLVHHRALLDGPPSLPADPPATTDAALVAATGDGVVQTLDLATLCARAHDADAHVTLLFAVGDYVVEGQVVAEVRPASAAEALPDDQLLSSVDLGRDRTMQQDVAFGFRQLVDIGEHALSPGINDPTTAVQAIDRIHGLLRDLVRREDPSRGVADDDGVERVRLPRAEWPDLVHLAFDELRQSGAQSVQVLRRLRSVLDDLVDAAPATRRPVLEEQRALLEAAVARAFPDEPDRRTAALPDAQGMGRTRGSGTDHRPGADGARQAAPQG